MDDIICIRYPPDIYPTSLAVFRESESFVVTLVDVRVIYVTVKMYAFHTGSHTSFAERTCVTRDEKGSEGILEPLSKPLGSPLSVCRGRREREKVG